MSDHETFKKELPYLFEVGRKVQFKRTARAGADTEGKIVARTIILDDFDPTLAYAIVTENGRQIKVREYDIVGAPDKEEE